MFYEIVYGTLHYQEPNAFIWNKLVNHVIKNMQAVPHDNTTAHI